jgi:hypothetical protein
MGTVFMYVNPFCLLGVNIAGNIRPFINDEYFFAAFGSFMCEDGSIKTGSDD